MKYTQIPSGPPPPHTPLPPAAVTSAPTAVRIFASSHSHAHAGGSWVQLLHTSLRPTDMFILKRPHTWAQGGPHVLGGGGGHMLGGPSGPWSRFREPTGAGLHCLTSGPGVTPKAAGCCRHSHIWILGFPPRFLPPSLPPLPPNHKCANLLFEFLLLLVLLLFLFFYLHAAENEA